MTTSEYILYIYTIGCILSFMLGCYDAYHLKKRGFNIDQFPNMIGPITFLSWLFIITYLYIKRVGNR